MKDQKANSDKRGSPFFDWSIRTAPWRSRKKRYDFIFFHGNAQMNQTKRKGKPHLWFPRANAHIRTPRRALLNDGGVSPVATGDLGRRPKTLRAF